MNIKSQQVLPEEERINPDEVVENELLKKYHEALMASENQVFDLQKENDEKNREIERLRSVTT